MDRIASAHAFGRISTLLLVVASMLACGAPAKDAAKGSGSGGASGAPDNDSPYAGDTPVVLASAQGSPNAIAIDATSIYWTNLGQLGGGKVPTRSTGSVMKMP